MTRKNIFNTGTFNVRGLTDEFKQEQLVHDVKKYKIDICCLQETKITENRDINIKDYRLITLQSNCRHYGNGFLISPKWKDRIVKYWKVSDRVYVIQLKLKEHEKYKVQNNPLKINLRITKTVQQQQQLLTIINVYAPTTAKVKNDANELHEMYGQIGNIINEVKNKNSSLLLLCGDFNAKIGKSKIKEPCVGRYSRGFRNDSGQSLINFCATHQLFISNSSFKHPARHITTWKNTRERNDTNIYIVNQIDYIIYPMNKKHCLIDARSFSNTLVDSDHRLVICKIEIEFHMF